LPDQRIEKKWRNAVTTQYTHIVDLAKEAEPPDDGILTRTLFNDDKVKAVIFGFGDPTVQQPAAWEPRSYRGGCAPGVPGFDEPR
jgi:hypothetical protein